MSSNLNKPFKKPSGDYFRLDLVIREAERGINGNKPILTDAIKVDYKSYIATMADLAGMSMTKYIHKLLDADMQKNKELYEKLKKKGCN